MVETTSWSESRSESVETMEGLECMSDPELEDRIRTVTSSFQTCLRAFEEEKQRRNHLIHLKNGLVRFEISSIQMFARLFRLSIVSPFTEVMQRESTGTAWLDDKSSGDPVQKAEAMAFRRACARFGLNPHDEDIS